MSQTDMPLTDHPVAPSLEDEVKQLRMERRRLKLVNEVGRLKRDQFELQESVVQFEWMQPWMDRFDEWRRDPSFSPPINSTTDRRYGANWPLYRNEQDLAVLRTLSRVTVETNVHGEGMLKGFRSYVIGKGMQVRATSKDNAPADLVGKVQDVIDEFCKRVNWTEFQWEVFERSRTDGEVFLRHFPQDDGTDHVRFVWPEQVRQPHDTESTEWSFGVENDPDDVEIVTGYWVTDLNRPEFGVKVPPEHMDHIKVGTMSGVKRGRPDFAFDTRDLLESARKARRNLSEGAAIQAAIAYIRQHDTATQAQVQGFVDSKSDYRVPRYSQSGDQDRNIQHVEPGQVIDMRKGSNYVEPPGPRNAQNFIAVIQMCLRSAGVKWNAPEWLGSADASNNNFASSLTAESPFVIRCECEQVFYAERFRRMFEKVILFAAQAGKLPPEAIDLVELQITPPSPKARNPAIDARNNQLYMQQGIKSPQTVTQEVGLDFENEQSNIAAFRKRVGPEGGAPPVGGGLPGVQPGEKPAPGSPRTPSGTGAVAPPKTESAEWEEDKHSRAADGKFGSGGSGGSIGSGDATDDHTDSAMADPEMSAGLDAITNDVPEEHRKAAAGFVRRLAAKVIKPLNVISHVLNEVTVSLLLQDADEYALGRMLANSQGGFDWDGNANAMVGSTALPFQVVMSNIPKVAGFIAGYLAKRKKAKAAATESAEPMGNYDPSHLLAVLDAYADALGVKAPTIKEVADWMAAKAAARPKTDSEGKKS